MTYFRDLDRCAYFDRGDVDPPAPRAVGWLSAERPFRRGTSSPELVDRLAKLIHRAWDPLRYRGLHKCGLCARSPTVMAFGDVVVEVGAMNLFIASPDERLWYAAPSLVLHYIVDHGYEAPEEFVVAALASPQPDSSAYFRAIDRLVPRDRQWRSGLFGFTNSLGAALSGEAGLTSWVHFWALDAEYGKRDAPQPRGGGQVPEWFAEQYLVPLAALRDSARSGGSVGDAAALESWLGTIAQLGGAAPALPP